MNVEQAELLVRAYWSAPPATATREAAAFRRVQDQILRDLAWQHWRPLYDRLGGDGGGIGEKPILALLWKLIDRRKAADCPIAGDWWARENWRRRHIA